MKFKSNKTTTIISLAAALLLCVLLLVGCDYESDFFEVVPNKTETAVTSSADDISSTSEPTTVPDPVPTVPELTTASAPVPTVPKLTTASIPVTTATKPTTTISTRTMIPVTTTTAPATTKVTTTKPTIVTTAIVPSDSLSVISITSPVGRNEKAEVTIHGKPNTEYSISVYYSTTVSSAAGLENKYSDADGNLLWTWKVGGKTKPGEHRIVISGGGERITVYFTTTE